MKRIVLLTGLVSIILTACTRSSVESTPTPTVAPLPSATPIPSTPTPIKITIRVTSELVNCRFGPGTNYQLVTELRQGQTVQALGRNETSTWWNVQDPGNPGGTCWVFTEVTEALGNDSQLPIAPPPFVTVTNVDLRVEPNRIVVACNQFPQTVFFEAQITTNGPTLLTWKWEVSTGVSSNEGAMIFEQAGTQVINEYYQINAPGDYSVKLLILAPNEQIHQVTFPVTCTP